MIRYVASWMCQGRPGCRHWSSLRQSHRELALETQAGEYHGRESSVPADEEMASECQRHVETAVERVRCARNHVHVMLYAGRERVIPCPYGYIMDWAPIGRPVRVLPVHVLIDRM